MQKVLTAAEMREVDRLTTERYGIPSIILMENAAHAVARVITEKLGGSVKGKSILILCGKGNNGGDGAALARILSNSGANVDAILFGQIDETKGDARTNFLILKRTEIEKMPVEYPHEFWKYNELSLRELEETGRWNRQFRVKDTFDVVVDAIFGSGLDRKLDVEFAKILENSWFDGDPIFRKGAFLTVSVDIPSGLMSDRSEKIGISPYVDVTVTFTSPKIGNILPPASNFNGQLVVADIGSPSELIEDVSSQVFLAEDQDAEVWLHRSGFSHGSYKNKRGHVLVIAGSEDYSGAAVLAGDAAMRSGVGLVTVVTPRSSKDSVASRVLPEVMVRGVAETERGSISETAFDEIGDLLEKADSIAIGCGLAQSESTKTFVEKLLANRGQPVVVDADALNLVSPFEIQDADKGVRVPSLILTPHEGEFLRLLGTDDKDAIKDRVAAVRDFATKHNVILVLKGERVLIGAPDGRVVVNPTGNSGLGKAGNGDTLTGILAGFVAQAAKMNIDIVDTVVAAVYVAGMAGDIAEMKYGKRVMTASDVRECLVEVFVQFEKK